MGNKKINELSVRVPIITDLIGVGDPATGYLYKSTLQQLQDLIEANIALTDLTDVTISAPSSGQVLRYDGSVWVNATETFVGTVTSVAMSVPTGLTISGTPITTSGTLALTFTSGYSIPTNASQANWDTAYTNRITSLTTTGASGAATLITNVLNIPTYTLSGLGGQPQLNGTGFVKISGTTISYDNSTYLTTISGIAAGGDLSGTYVNPTVLNSAVIGKVLTGYTSGAGTVAATDTILQAFQKLNGNIGALTTGVSSVFGRTGAVVATEGDYTLTQLSDVTITTPSSGQVLKYNGTAWVNNSDTDTGITTLNTLTALTQTFAVGTSGTDFAISSATSTHTYNLPTASATNRGALSSVDWTIFNNKQATISLTTTGTSGAATFSANTLNIPNYGSALSGYLPLTGGTLTGALTGTSATFSLASTGSGAVVSVGNVSSGVFGGLAITDGGTYPMKIWGSELQFLTGNSTFGSATTRLTIASTGAATFSSNVTSNGNTISVINASGSADYVADRLNTSSGATFQYKTNGSLKWYTGLRGLANNMFYIFNNATSTNTLILDESTNGATFSSSVTATSLIKSGGTSAQYLMADGSISTLTNPVTGTGTTNYLPKFTGASTIGNSLVFDNGTNVGINTISPSVKLTVKGAATAGLNETINIETGGVAAEDGGSLSFTLGGFIASYPNWRIGQIGAIYESTNSFNGALVFKTSTADDGGTIKMRLSSSGNLGLGVTPSTWGATQKAIEVNGATIMGASGINAYYSSNAYYNAGWKYINAGSYAAALYASENGSHNWSIAAAGTAGNAITFTQAMTLTAAGRLLVGTSTESTFLLDVNGTGRFSSSVDATVANLSSGLKVTGSSLASGTGAEIVYSSGKGLFLTFNRSTSTYLPTEIDGSTVTLSISGTPKLTIASTGAATFSSSVTVGGALLVSYANARASINSTTATNSSYLSFGNTITGYVGLDNSAGTDFGNGAYSLNLINGGAYNLNLGTSNTTRLAITSGGNVGIGTTAIFSGAKTDIRGTYTPILSNASSQLFVGEDGTTQTVDKGGGITFGGYKSGTASQGYYGNIAGLSEAGVGTYTGYLAFSTSTGGDVLTEKVRITSTGNVGIGTTSPVAALHVQSASTKLFLSNTDFVSGTTGSGLILSTGASSGQTYSQIYAFQTGNTAYANLVVPGGNVGIGTTNPQTLLHVDTTGTDARIRVSAGTNTVQGGMIANSSTNLVYAGSVSNHGFSLRTNDADRVRIDTTGNVGIGTTSPSYKLEVNGTTHIFGQTNIGQYDGGAVYPAQSGYALSLGEGSTGSGKSLICDGAIAIGNTVSAAVAVASTHKVQISIGGTTYYLLSTNV